MRLKRYWPWPKNVYDGRTNPKRSKIARKFGIGKTSKGWTTHNKRIKRIYPAYYYKEEIKGFLTQYPFNRYGWTDFKYWFKYRLQKKYQYHKHNLGLKPGYYELDVIYEKAIAHDRFFYVFDELYSHWHKDKNTKAYDGSNIYTKEYATEMRVLKKAADWIRIGKPKMEKQIADFYASIPEKPKGMGFMEYLEHRRDKDRTIYKKIAKLETAIYKNTTDALVTIVKNRGCLYT